MRASVSRVPTLDSRLSIRLLVVVVLLALAGLAPAQSTRTTLLLDTPTADVMPVGSFAISPIATWPIGRTPSNYPGWEGGVSLHVSPIEYMEVAVNAYTPVDYVVNASYQIISGRGERISVLEMFDAKERAARRLVNEEAQRLSLAVGVYDLGINSYVSPLGHGLDTGSVWPDWMYEHRPMENFSAFVVASIPVTGVARISIGLGRGRFVGYDGPNAYLNTDIFFKEQHQWAVGLFGGLEVYLAPQVALCAEVAGRDANAGIKAFVGPLTAMVALYKMEGLLFATGPNKFGRGAIEVSYQLNNLFRPRVPAARPPRPSRFGSVEGKVLDAGTGGPLEAQVALGSRAQVTGRGEGSFAFDSVVPPGPYAISAAARGYQGSSTKVGVTAGTVSLIDIRLTPEPGGEAPPAALPNIVPDLTDLEHEAIYFGSDKPDLTFDAAALLYDVPTVYFLPGKADITPEAASILRVHANLLKSNPSLKMTILGRADAPGPADPAAKLAEQRAVATFEYLKSLGVPAEQLVFKGVAPGPNK